MTRGRSAVLVGVVGTLSVGFVLAAQTVSEQRYASAIAGVQAIAVVAGVWLAVATLTRDSRDRRVDRTLALHREFMTGEIWLARHRLVAHLRRNRSDEHVQRVTRRDVQEHGDERMRLYGAGEPGRPLPDVDLLMRFFERAYAALRTGALDEQLFAELVGRHAFWWEVAIVDDGSWLTRQPLHDLAKWCRGYMRAHAESRSGVTSWLDTVRRDFGDEALGAAGLAG